MLVGSRKGDSKMKRFALIVLLLMLFQSAAFAIGPAYSGAWFNPDQSGHGFSLIYSERFNGEPVMVGYWYVYDTDGNPIFLVGVGEPEEGNTVTLEFDAPYGMRFGEFDPAQIVHADAGTGVFTFQNEESGVFNYEPSDWIANAYGLSAVTTPVKKLLGVAHPNIEPPPTGEPVPLPGLWSGRMVYDRVNAGSGTCYDAGVSFNVKTDSRGYDSVIKITVNRDSGGMSVFSFPYEGEKIINMYLAGTMKVFATNIDINLRFDDYGYADGIWSYQTGDCYGTWSFHKE